jgi:pyruvate/2-oxoglutarate/acetoin dehydrogenase E1 component/TPP-dependent pyruvate/acetoin dehydrogenase alpha subunit
MLTEPKNISDKNTGEFKSQVLMDYKLAHISRQCSLMARREVLSGKAKFGIFGDGKEVAQIAMAKYFEPGDWRSGYYRDQTFLFATGMSDPKEFFAQLYGDTDIGWNPGNGGRSFNNHYATRLLDDKGDWKVQTEMFNTTADLSPTAAQMPRIVGLGYASKLYRNNPELKDFTKFSIKGNEVVFGTIGDASTAEGHFFETMNAAAVLQIPVAVAVWDDGYGISVTKDYQIVKSSVSEALKGFEKREGENGIYIYYGKGWDYPGLIKIFNEGIVKCREEHVPVLFHIDELTQPLGHSTSGSHERYKSRERLEWENDHDPLLKMKEWILEKEIATREDLENIEEEAVNQTREAQKAAWLNYQKPIRKEREELLKILNNRSCNCRNDKIDKIALLSNDLKKIANPFRRDIMSTAKRILRHICLDCPVRDELQKDIGSWLTAYKEQNYIKYSAGLYNESYRSALKVNAVPPVYTEDSKIVNAREVIMNNFDKLFATIPELVTFGEDTGKIGDVNKGLEGLQDKYGELRITDTGIRETTIIGQGIGMALRGLRPVAEIQYFDYLLYGLQTISDDLATLHYRTKAGQAAPMIIRTRGHRLEGIWHSGSPLSMVINSIRGVYVCVPRDMTRAAGFYNTLVQADDPALVIEPLNAYRLKEKLPDNLGNFTVPLGVPEILQEGEDITLVTYGSCVRIAQSAIEQLKEFDISVELIDVQTLLPFDVNNTIVKSLEKTNRVVFFDEDVPGGATAYMMQKVIEEQKGFYYLDSEPRTLSARDHRPAYGSDGDYFSNPNTEDVFEVIYGIMHEADPEKYPAIY